MTSSTTRSAESHLRFNTLPQDNSGYALIGVLALIVALAIAAGVAVQNITPSLDESRRAETEREMELLAKAIAGDYALGGSMSGADFGYVGDVGTLPASLTELKTNSAALATWNGPYMRDPAVEAVDEYLNDAWGAAYSYSGVSIQSSGSGAALAHQITRATTDLTGCGLSGKIIGSAGLPPGALAGDLIAVITYPDGLGGTTRDTASVTSDGDFIFSGIPIGLRQIQAIDLVQNDSALIIVSILPRSTPANSFVGTLRLPNAAY